MNRKQFLNSSIFAGITISTGNYKNNNRFDEPLLKPFYIKPTEKVNAGPMGLNVKTLVKSELTNKQVSCIEGVIEAKKMGPAPHTHQELDEMMYVTEGTISVLVGKEVYEVKAGGFLFRPHGIVHTFWNSTDKTARFIDFFFNQDFEKYLEEMFGQILPNAMKKGLAPNAKEVVIQMDDLNYRFGVVEFPEQRQAIVEKYGLS